MSGITRDTVIEIARQLGFKVIETDISLEQMVQADEAFFTGTAVEVTAIRSVNDRLFSDGQIPNIKTFIPVRFCPRSVI